MGYKNKLMKRILMIIPILFTLLLSNCKEEKKNIEIQDKEAVSPAKDTLSNKIRNHNEEAKLIDKYNFTEKKELAILIGDTIECLDKNLHLVDNIKLKEGELVHITAVSNSLFKKTSEYCDSYNLVKIDINGSQKLIDGRNAYKLDASLLDTINPLNHNHIELFRTSFYGIGSSDNEGLTFCTKYEEPLIIKDNTNYTGLINVIKDSVYLKVLVDSKFKYLQFMANDGMMDEIINANFTKKGIVLYVYRSFQEGYTNYQILLKKVKEGYTARYLNYPKTKYNFDNYFQEDNVETSVEEDDKSWNKVDKEGSSIKDQIIEKLIKQLGIKKITIFKKALAIKMLINEPDKAIVVIPVVDGEIEDGISCNIHVVLINTKTNKIIASLFKTVAETNWYHDGFYLENISIKENIFQLNSKTKAYNLIAHLNRAYNDNRYKSKTSFISLFIQENDRLKMILNNKIIKYIDKQWNEDCQKTNFTAQLKGELTKVKTKTNGYNDLSYKLNSIIFTEDCYQIPSKENEEIHTFKFNGDSYIIEKE